MTLVRNPAPTVSFRMAVLCLLAFMEGCTVMGSGRTKPEPDAGEILYIRVDPEKGRDLWIQSLDSGRHRSLTSSGRVELEPGGEMPGFWRGVAISPEGTQVAYAERHASEGPGPGGSRGEGWNALFVVNADGTGRRKLVDLTQQPVPEGQHVRAGRFTWSDDGSSIAYALESRPMNAPSGSCADVSFHSVDVSSGRSASLFNASPLKAVTPLGWSPARAEVVFYDECDLRKRDLPMPKGRVTRVRVKDGATSQQPARQPSMSPDGMLIFIPLKPEASVPPTLHRTEELGGSPTVTLELPASHVGRIHWLHHAPAALLSATKGELPFVDCVGTHPQPRVLFRLDLGTGTLQRVREDAHALKVVAISPNDMHALVGIVTGEDDRFHPPCVSRPVERLFLVRLDELASELPIQELKHRARPLTPPRLWSDVEAFNEYVGWVR